MGNSDSASFVVTGMYDAKQVFKEGKAKIDVNQIIEACQEDKFEAEIVAIHATSGGAEKEEDENDETIQRAFIEAYK